MTGFDRTGTDGQGPRTGRQMGKHAQPDEKHTRDEIQFGRGAGKGMGRGMGRGTGRVAGRANRMRGGRGMSRG